MQKIGFIGCGNMGGALAEAAAKSGNEILLFDTAEDKAKALAEKIGGCSVSLSEIAKQSDYIFLGVKPQIMPAALPALCKELGDRKPVLISMAAGMTIEKLLSLAGGEYPIIRIMPNTPVAVGSGMILYTAACDEENTEEFLSFMAAAGRFSQIPESLMDAASAVSGCGPAFACQFIEALADGAVSCGLPRDKAIVYAAAMLEGTAKLVLETGTHPAALKDAVCSPGGSTIEGVRCLEKGAFRGTVSEAVEKSYKRTKELGK